jgi:hypothetical protein
MTGGQRLTTRKDNLTANCEPTVEIDVGVYGPPRPVVGVMFYHY